MWALLSFMKPWQPEEHKKDELINIKEERDRDEKDGKVLEKMTEGKTGCYRNSVSYFTTLKTVQMRKKYDILPRHRKHIHFTS